MIISYIPKSLDDLAYIYNEMNDLFLTSYTSVARFTAVTQKFINKIALMAFVKGNNLIVIWDVMKETSEHEDTLESFHQKVIELKLTSIL